MATSGDSGPDFGDDPFPAGEARGEGERLTVSLAHYEGPLDLLLDLARRNRLDLRAISIAALADQYLAYIGEARRLRLEIAGDYLVMGAWLAFLKSRLILPARAEEPDVEAVDLAGRLAERLRRLESVRHWGEMLAARFAAAGESLPRGAGEAVILDRAIAWQADLNDLVAAYAGVLKSRAEPARYRIGPRASLPIPEARDFMTRELARATDWTAFDSLLARFAPARAEPQSLRASTFAASLEIVREGGADLRQEANFAPIFLRKAKSPPLPAETAP